MATGPITTTNQANIVPEQWESKIIYSFYQANHMARLLDNFDVPLGIDTQNFPTLGTFTAEAITEGTDLSGKDITPGQIQLVMDQYYGVPVTFTQKVLAQNQFTLGLIDKYAERMGQALAYQQEAVLLTLYSSMSQQITGLTNLTIDAILNAKQLIFQAGVPQYVGDQREQFNLVVTPYQYRKMLQLSGISSSADRGAPTAIKGILEEIYGCTIYVTNNIAVNSSYYNNMLFHKNYAMVGTQIGVTFLIEDKIQPHTLSRKASASHLWGYVEEQDGFGVALPTTN